METKNVRFDADKTIQFVTLEIPAHLLTAAIAEVRTVKEAWDAIEAQRAALMPVTVESVGRLGMEERQKQLDEFERQKEAATGKARASIAKLAQQYTPAIDKQTTPSGADIAGNPDFELLKNQLVETPAELVRILERNDNRTFRAAASRYAAGKNWDGFSYADNEKAVREFGQGFFEACERAAGSPAGYSSMFVLNGGVLVDMARSYGVLDELEAGSRAQ